MPEILGVAFNLQFGCHIQNAAQTQKGVDAKAHETVGRRLPLELHGIVHARPGVLQVRKEVADAPAHWRGQHITVDRGDRLDYSHINHVVKPVDPTVE